MVIGGVIFTYTNRWISTLVEGKNELPDGTRQSTRAQKYKKNYNEDDQIALTDWVRESLVSGLIVEVQNARALSPINVLRQGYRADGTEKRRVIIDARELNNKIFQLHPQVKTEEYEKWYSGHYRRFAQIKFQKLNNPKSQP